MPAFKRRTKAEKRGLAKKKAARVRAGKEYIRRSLQEARRVIRGSRQWDDQELLEAVIRKDPEAMAFARAQGDLIREQLRRRHGNMNIAVQLVRESRR